MDELMLKAFFDAARVEPFRGQMTRQQVDSLELIIDAWEEFGDGDAHKLAYIMATAYHEVGVALKPVREGFRSSDKEARAYVQRHYGHKGDTWYCWPDGPYDHVYYGRGFVQLTWLANYEKMSERLGIDLVRYPDKALDADVAAKIMVIGMLEGLFTKKSLANYFNGERNDAVGARRIVNGTDRAQKIANYYDDFLDALMAADEAEGLAPMSSSRPTPRPAPEPRSLPPASDRVSVGGGTLGAAGTVGTLMGAINQIDDPTKLIAFGIVAALMALGAYLLVTGRISLTRETGR